MRKILVQVMLGIFMAEVGITFAVAADALDTREQKTVADIAKESAKNKKTVKEQYKPSDSTTEASEKKADIPPLKNADTPAIGRNQQPLDELVLTPPELPRVTVRLSTEQESEDDLEDMTSAYTGRIPRTTPVVVEPFPQQQKPAPQPVTATPQPKKPQLYDVSTFEIAGLKLGMSPDEVIQDLTRRGFVLQRKEMGMPPYHTQHYTRLCRQNYYLLEDVKECIRAMAVQNQTAYVLWLTAKNSQTREYVKALFTSHATGNQLYKLYYEVKGDNSIGWGLKAMSRKNENKEGFWDLLFALYGYPDDGNKMIWGDEQHAFMQATVSGGAYNGYIVLLDRDRAAEDYFAAEDAYHQALKPPYRALQIGTPLPEVD